MTHLPEYQVTVFVTEYDGMTEQMVLTPVTRLNRVFRTEAQTLDYIEQVSGKGDGFYTVQLEVL